VAERMNVEAKHKEFIRAPRERVYDAFATSAGINGWWTEGGSVDARPDGAMVFRLVDWGPDQVNTEFTGTVVAAERPRRFVYRWGGEGPQDATTVELTFEEREDGTVVSVREYGFVRVDQALGNAAGWGEVLTLVKFWIEHGLRLHQTPEPHGSR
jgi:uncharacterized protein YndB with AHSA1/START domain